ncbi:1-acyl-sn-glycerol-3-phosphate acyltransferase [Desulfosarcina sp. OttesenSCG-928-G17]|nr:1-acyl-sn-glycerol-3-phosphate acyltransferase [Desulfosarcina sp. OttesenSCG-928-G17]
MFLNTKKIIGSVKRLFFFMTGPSEKLFTCWVPARIGVFSTFILRRLFSRVTPSPDTRPTLESLPDNAVVVYVSKQKSYFELLYYYIRYMQESLPFPQLCLGFNIRFIQPVGRLIQIIGVQIHHFWRHFAFRNPYDEGFVREEIQNGATAFLPLIGKREFYHSFVKSKTDPLRYLLQVQRETDRPICLVPQLMFFSKRPISAYPSLMDIIFGSPQDPGRFRRLVTLFNMPNRIFIEVSDPVNLQTFLSLPENRGHGMAYLAMKLRRELITQIDAYRKSITGPAIKLPEEIKQEILTSDELRKFMVSYAKRHQMTLFEAHGKAIRYLDEISAKYSPSAINLMHRFTKRMLNLIFESVTVRTPAISEIKRAARKGPIIFMPAHKSHMDSVLLSSTLYEHHMPCPHIFAGKNLGFWPMGPILRRMGAFLVRRSFKGAIFYAKVFSAYIFQLLKEGFNVAVYIEGTRSRSGKLLQPQVGMLSILLRACFEGACTDLVFVPVFISYDRIPDEGTYLHEISGGKKSPESFRQILKAKSLFKNRYGSVHLNFGQPLALSDVLAEHQFSRTHLSSKQQNAVCRQISNHVITAIDQQTVVTPQSLVAGALLSGGKEIISTQDLEFRIKAIMGLLRAQNTQLSDSLIPDPRAAVEKTLYHYQGRKFIQRPEEFTKSGNPGDSWRIVENHRIHMDYYKNISICHFVPAAFTAMAILEKDAFQFSATELHHTYFKLEKLFSEEFHSDAVRPSAFIVRKTVKAFINMAVLVPHPALPDTYNLSSEGFRKLIFFSGYLEPFIAAYQTALVYFSKNRRNLHDRNKMLKHMLSAGNRMLRQGEIRVRESISKVTYDNAINFFMKNEVKGSEDEENIRKWEAVLAHYQHLITR